MKFFVSGKFEDRGNIRRLMNALENLGHTITYDWTIDEETDEGYPIISAVNDARGVQVCDVLVCRFIEKNSYRGSLSELGMAIVLNKRIFIIGHAVDSCIFVNHPSAQRFESENEFLSYVRQVL